MRKREIIADASDCPIVIVKPPLATLDPRFTVPPFLTISRVPTVSFILPPSSSATTAATTTTTSTTTTTKPSTSSTTTTKIASTTSKTAVAGSEKEGVGAKDDANQAGDMVSDSSGGGTDTGPGGRHCRRRVAVSARRLSRRLCCREESQEQLGQSHGNYNPESPLPAHSRPAAPLPEAAAGGTRTPVYGAAPRKSEEIGEYRYVPCDAALTDGGTIQSAGSDSTYGELHLSPREPLPGLAQSGGSFQ
jgi:hypothetical protein